MLHGFEVIERNARAQHQLSADYWTSRALSQVSLGLSQGVVELIPMIEAALETVRPAAEAKGVQLQFQVDSAAGVSFRGCESFATSRLESVD
jgi:hypothetical protein